MAPIGGVATMIVAVGEVGVTAPRGGAVTVIVAVGKATELVRGPRGAS